MELDLLGKRLAQIRNENGLSQQNLASVLGVGVNTVIRYEKGRQMPKADFLVKISKLGVGYDEKWILTGDGPVRAGAVHVTRDAVRDDQVGVRGDPWAIIAEMAARISKMEAEMRDLRLQIRHLTGEGPPPKSGD